MQYKDLEKILLEKLTYLAPSSRRSSYVLPVHDQIGFPTLLLDNSPENKKAALHIVSVEMISSNPCYKETIIH